MRCKCGSHAINHHLHGRDGSRPDLCDVCYWRAQVSALQTALKEQQAEFTRLTERYTAECQSVAALQKEAKHWKDQHKNEVNRAYVLKGDAEIHQVRAYELMGELQGQVEQLKADYNAIEKRESEAWSKYHAVVSERDQLRAEAERLTLENAQQRTILEDAFKSGRITVEVADLSTSYKKGAESMRERVYAIVASDAYGERAASGKPMRHWLLEAIRALSLKENKG